MDKYDRMRALRRQDPDGLRSTNDLERQAEIELLAERIEAMSDFPEDALELRQILSDIVGLLPKRDEGD